MRWLHDLIKYEIVMIDFGMEALMAEQEKFDVKDSGERQKFESGMQRDTTAGKPRYDLIFDGPLMARYAEHLRKGALKYEPRNWMKARSREEMDRFRQSAARHFAQWMAGNTDEDHAAAVVFNINGHAYVQDKLNAQKS